MEYELLCVCGQTLRGARQRRHQVVRCAACGHDVFVLPQSPRAPCPGKAAPVRSASSWRTPAIAVAVCLALLGATFTLVWYSLKQPAPEAKPVVADDVRKLIDAGQRTLARGRFRLALRQFHAAMSLRDRHPQWLSPAEHRRLNQLQRQADVLAYLLAVPLEEVVRQGTLVTDPEEWDLQFADYRGRSVFFDDIVRRDVRGRPVLAHHVIEVGDRPVRLALEDLAVFHDLPLADAPRMLFAARLQACQREQGGGWVVRFAPESGVLFTDGDAVTAAACVALDPGLQETLLRQQSWLEERAGAAPARR